MALTDAPSRLLALGEEISGALSDGGGQQGGES